MARQRSSLSLDDVISIRTLIGIGIRTKTIAEQFHTSKQNIQRIKSAKTWGRYAAKAAVAFR